MEKEEFCEQFVAAMMTYASVFEGTREALLTYAEAVAPTYWAEPDQREEGPETCAHNDVSYWES